MFGLFKKKSEKDKLIKKHKELLAESHRLSKIDRTQSDAKLQEAEELWKKIEKMED